MALDTIPKQEGGKLKAVASGTLPSGQPVVVNADGTVSVISETDQVLSSPTVFEVGAMQKIGSAFDSNSNKIVLVYRDGGNSAYGTAIVGTVSGSSVSFGSPTVFQSASISDVSIDFDTTANKVVVAYNSTGGKAIVGTVSGTSISFGSAVTVDGGLTTTIQNSAVIYDSSNNKSVVILKDGGNNDNGYAYVGTVSGTSISFGSSTLLANSIGNTLASTYDSNSNKVVIGYSGAKVKVGTVSGTSISFGSETDFTANTQIGAMGMAFDTNANKIVVSYGDFTDNTGKAIVGTVSGTSISFGTPVAFSTGGETVDHAAAFDASAGKVVFAFRDGGNSQYGTVTTGTVSGTSISFDTETVFESARSEYMSAVYDSNAQKSLIAYGDVDNSYYGTSVVFAPGSTNLTSENYIGMSGGVVTGSASAVGTPAVSSAVQSSYFGSTFDSNSNKVVVTYWDQTNSKGMAVVGTVSGTSISFGTPVQYSSQSAFTYSQAVVFDSNSNKVVIAYVDSGGSSYGTAIVGTVSGTSISFGTAVVFESASTAYPQATFDNVNNKVIIAYEDGGDSDKGKAVVGTVSGTSISFGSTATFNAGGTSYPAVAYDTNAQKVVVAYRDKSASDHGKAVVGTVSGTSISFGSATTFNAANTNYNIVVYDEAAQKVVVYYQGADTNMEAIVGTVSGTSISFGTAAEFSASNSTNMSATYDANAAKTVVFYRDASNSSYGTYNVGTIDGTSISFSDPVVFEEADSRFTTGTYDSNSQKVVVSYEDVGNSQYATSTVINVGYINRGEVSDGDNATVDIVGTVSTNQVGLTAGQQYYVQTDGTIGTTPADPSVLAGTAVSATKMVVKS